jgi:hypothetical protein
MIRRLLYAATATLAAAAAAWAVVTIAERRIGQAADWRGAVS